MRFTPVCADCLEADGLCKRCAKQIVPQLARPAWIWLIYFKYVSQRAAEITRRQLRQAERAKLADEARRRGLRISTLLRGGFSPARRAV